MGISLEEQQLIHTTYREGRDLGELLLDIFSTEPQSTAHVVEENVALLFDDSSGLLQSRFQGAWHTVGTIPLCNFLTIQSAVKGVENE